MRLLSKYVMRQLFPPFIFSLLVIVFILFTNFFLRAIDRFLGKGLNIFTIFEYLFLNLAWIVALAVPMAVLIAALMTFGRMSEENEITAMRTSGISYLKIIRPVLFFGTIVAIILIYFNNYILPDMNFRARLLSGDIYRKRPDMNIDPGHFIDDIPDYSMIIRGKEGNLMKDVRIFSKSPVEAQTSIYSESGTLHTDENLIVLTLFNGEIHELDLDDFGNYRRIAFEKHIINIPADDLVLMRRDSASRRDREMTIPMMLTKYKSYEQRIDRLRHRIGSSFKKTTGDSISPQSLTIANAELETFKENLKVDSIITKKDRTVKNRQLNRLQRQLKNEFNLINSYSRSKNKYSVEIHKKITLPVACILFAVVGGGLGVLVRKGGFAVATSLSFGFFLIYYIFLIGGEELADRNIISPFLGMWSPNIFLAVVAGYLTLHTVRERAPIQFNFSIRKYFKKES
ncbi:MAG: YjgP/YjgQ family permease [Candidatus Marinimicrobia bacterium]|jgi:lipopolysaccharide export system permease protein|nr:YjgP/YjgQ family permease [Candidatus Neomarinimicrobiota bacterium]MBT6930833.1 YjgP/YjgQ family permease [Candidatus Neomarinimicrobiota bacterium]